MFRKLRLLTTLLALTLSVKAIGNPCCGSDWALYADWLYWKASRDGLDYAIPDETTPSFASKGKIASVQPSYHSGFRVGLFNLCNSRFFDIFYTRFHNEDRESKFRLQSATRNLELFQSNDYYRSTIFASGSYESDLDTVDLLMGYKINVCSCLNPYFFGGIKLAFVDQNFTAFYSETDLPFTANVAESSQDVNMNGYGIDLGLGGQYDICRCLNFFGRLSVDLLLGDFEQTYKYKIGDSGLLNQEVVDLCENSWKMVTALNLSFGLQYDYLFSGCFCHNLGISIGYEFYQFLNMADFLDYKANTSSITLDRNVQNIGFSGLIVRLIVGF